MANDPSWVRVRISSLCRDRPTFSNIPRSWLRTVLKLTLSSTAASFSVSPSLRRAASRVSAGVRPKLSRRLAHSRSVASTAGKTTAQAPPRGRGAAQAGGERGRQAAGGDHIGEVRRLVVGLAELDDDLPALRAAQAVAGLVQGLVVGGLKNRKPWASMTPRRWWKTASPAAFQALAPPAALISTTPTCAASPRSAASAASRAAPAASGGASLASTSRAWTICSHLSGSAAMAYIVSITIETLALAFGVRVGTGGVISQARGPLAYTTSALHNPCYLRRWPSACRTRSAPGDP
uniref:Uncharacterized protein n=1 Tax=Phenylobacterium glaciei TaxID=2803784 RepID=A0A974P5Z3_9CAUL|nr:hypothetical protein JKL49_08900 [Phenylobacterium glaciei]